MKIIEGIKLKGKIKIQVLKDGKVVKEVETENIITNVGRADVAGLINSTVTSPFTYVAVGSGTASPSATDTALQNERMRTNATVSRTTAVVPNDTARWEAVFTATSDMVLTEAGLFNASSGGDMLARGTFPAVSVASGESFRVIWHIIVGV